MLALAAAADGGVGVGVGVGVGTAGSEDEENHDEDEEEEEEDEEDDVGGAARACRRLMRSWLAALVWGVSPSIDTCCRHHSWALVPDGTGMPPFLKKPFTPATGPE